jgi:hypothetical protein
MPLDKFPPPPKVNAQFDQWLLRFWKAVEGLGEAQSGTTSHTSLTNLNSSSYSHLTATEKDDLTDSGNSILHYHSTDRDRSNHTGTQTADTISDFETAVSSVVTGGSVTASATGIIESQVFGG